MTLVEVVVSTAILSFVVITLMALVSQSLNGWCSGLSKNDATGDATLALQKLSTEVLAGKAATVSGSTLTVTFPATLTDATTHETIYDLSGSDPVTRSYYLLNNNLVRNVSGTITVLARNIYPPSSGSVFAVSGGSITVNFSGQEQNGTRTSTYQVTGRLVLRNFR